MEKDKYKNTLLGDKLYTVFYIIQTVLWIVAFLCAMVALLMALLLTIMQEANFDIYSNFIFNSLAILIIACFSKIIFWLIYKAIGIFLNIDLKSIDIFEL